MKLKLSELKPNPFKKEIGGGKLNEEIISKIQGSLKELGLMGSLPVTKKGNNYFLIAGHHRAEALKRMFGKDHEIEITLHNYSDENILRGMVVENLTQRSDELVEVTENLNAVRNWLKANSPAKFARDKFHQSKYFQSGIKEIYSWLSQNGEVMSAGKISQYLSVHDKLDKSLLKQAVRMEGGQTKEGQISIEEAKILSLLDKKEQLVMKELLGKTGLDYKNKGKLVTAYKKAPEEIQEKVKKEEIDIKNINFEVDKFLLEKARKEKGQIKIETIKQNINNQFNYLRFSLADSKDKITQSLRYLSILYKYLKDMDDKQKERLDKELLKYEDLFKKMGDLISEVREKI